MAAQDSGEDGPDRAQTAEDSCSGGGAEAKWRGRHGAAGLNFCDSAVGDSTSATVQWESFKLFCDAQTDRALAALRGDLGG